MKYSTAFTFCVYLSWLELPVYIL